MNQNYFSISFLSLSLLLGGCTQQSEQRRPNVIIVMADDMGYNDLSSYRKLHPVQSDQPSTSKTPAIDELAEEGMYFTDFYAGAPVSSPSRAALLTGRNATRVGIYNHIPPENSPMRLRSEEITLAEMLKEENYQTGHFGKWHLSQNWSEYSVSDTQILLPNNQGFDYSFHTWNNARPSHKNPVNFYRNGEPLGELEGYACQLVVDEAVNWLEDREKSDPPFYINIWFNEPHWPLAAPDSLTSRHSYRSEYFGSIENMDIAVGRLMDYLEKNELEEETIVIFLSDNGSQYPRSNVPFYGEKVFLFEGGIRVPFIIRWPGKVPANSFSEVPASITDILPSIAQFTGAELPDNYIDGNSLVPVFTGESSHINRKHPIFFYRYMHEPICMLREGDYILLGYDSLITKAEDLEHHDLNKLEPWSFRRNHMEFLDTLKPSYFELYNIRKDTGQENNIAEKHPKKVDRMKEKMLNLRDEMVKEGVEWFDKN